jgi:hypothetical protein
MPVLDCKSDSEESAESGVQSGECGVGSAECGVRSGRWFQGHSSKVSGTTLSIRCASKAKR